MEQKRGSSDMMVPIVLGVVAGMWVLGVTAQLLAQWIVNTMPN
jgi:hypothetical protein